MRFGSRGWVEHRERFPAVCKHNQTLQIRESFTSVKTRFTMAKVSTLPSCGRLSSWSWTLKPHNQNTGCYDNVSVRGPTFPLLFIDQESRKYTRAQFHSWGQHHSLSLHFCSLSTTFTCNLLIYSLYTSTRLLLRAEKVSFNDHRCIKFDNF